MRLYFGILARNEQLKRMPIHVCNFFERNVVVTVMKFPLIVSSASMVSLESHDKVKGEQSA